MTTKKCPYCGKEVLAVAKKCRYCGKWIETHTTDTTLELAQCEKKGHQISNETTSDDTEKKIPYYVPLAFFGVFIAVMILAMNKSCSSNSQTEADATEVTHYADPELMIAETEIEPTSTQPATVKLTAEEMRYNQVYENIKNQGICVLWADGKKIWAYEPDNEVRAIVVYDSDINDIDLIRLNKTSMPNDQMFIDDIAANNGIITVIMSERRNSNGWVDGTHVWQYNCDTGAWKCIANVCSGAEFINNRTAVKIDNAECINPDAMTVMEMEYRHNYKTIKL